MCVLYTLVPLATLYFEKKMAHSMFEALYFMIFQFNLASWLGLGEPILMAQQASRHVKEDVPTDVEVEYVYS